MTKTYFDSPFYQLHSHSEATARAAAYGQLPCFWAMVKNRGPLREEKR